MKFLLIYNIFYKMWYAEHVMNHEYLQTDAIGGRERCLSEQCSPISGLTQAKHSRLSRAMRIQVYTHCPSFSFLHTYAYRLASESVWIFAQMTCI